MRKYFFFTIAIFGAGCLSDEITKPEAQYLPVYQPGGIYYKAITGTLDLEIRWNPPVSSIQQNFKGYFLKLYNSVDQGVDKKDSIDGPPIDSVHVPKSDTLYTFLNKVVQDRRYTV